MPQNNEIVAALPASGPADKELLRSWAVTRNSFNLRPDEDLQDFVMIDPEGGGTTPSVVQNGMLYGHDEDDTTTAHDGVTCLVSYDAQRYKLETGLHAPFNVLDKDLTAPPTSPAPSYGDAYLIYGSPTGAWSGKSGYIAIYTARGWSFCLPPIGFLVYARDENSYYHRDNLGAWVLGTGTRTLGDNSVSVSNIIGKVVRFNVINQTTTAPPLSPAPSVGDQYIIGPSATGDWAGLDGRIAICEDGSTFTVYQPSNGWAAYDKTLNNEYRFNGTAWIPAAGAVVNVAFAYYAANTNISAALPVDDTIPQTSETTEIINTSYTMRSAANRLKLTFKGYIEGNAQAVSVVCFHLAAETSARAVGSAYIDTINNPRVIELVHTFVPGTTAPLTLSIRAGVSAGTIRFNGSNSGRYFGGTMVSTLVIEELTP